MWFPTDDSFLTIQAQENLARAKMAIAASANTTAVAAAAANNASATTNATMMSDLFTSLHDVDPDTLMAIGTVAAVVLFWLTLCGVCRCVVFMPCPCCFCYIPCCCGFCLKEEREKERFPHDHHYHQHDVRHYQGIPKMKNGTAAYRQNAAEMPAYSSLTVDIEEPLLGPPAYSQPPAYEASPPPYHNVPTAPPLS